MLALTEELRGRGVALRVLNLGGGYVNTSTPMGSMLYTATAALAQMELDVKHERVRDLVSKRRANGGNLGGRPHMVTPSQIQNAARLIAANVPLTEVARELGISRATLYRRLKAFELPEVASGTPPGTLPADGAGTQKKTWTRVCPEFG